MSDDDEKQVSETAAMTPGGGQDAPGTDDGVPPAEDSQTEADGAPRDYRADRTVSDETTPQADPEDLG